MINHRSKNEANSRLYPIFIFLTNMSTINITSSKKYQSLTATGTLSKMPIPMKKDKVKH